MSTEIQHQYQLASCDSAQRRQAAKEVIELLKAVPRTELARFEDFGFDSDNSSDVPDPFSEDEIDQMDFAQRRKRLSKIEADLLLMSRFSVAHKIADQLVRQRTSRLTTDSPCHENLLEVRLSEQLHIEPLKSANEVDNLVAQCGLDVYLRQREAELNEKNAKKKKKLRSSDRPAAND